MLFRLEGEECNVTGALDGVRQCPLVFGAVAGDPASDDLSFFSQELCETLDILIIDESDLLAAKPANFLSKETPAGGTPFPVSVPVPAVSFPVSTSR